MFRIRMFIAGTALSLAAGTVVQAQASQQKTLQVNYEVQQINQITVTTAPTLTISTATAGSQPDSATATGTWAITTNDSLRKITVGLDSDMPANTILKIRMAAPGHGTSAGWVVLSSTAATTVDGIYQIIGSSLNIDYQLNATVDAGIIAAAHKTATFTIAAMP
jgi:hypothetical protein